jgi:hypothetical protein
VRLSKVAASQDSRCAECDMSSKSEEQLDTVCSHVPCGYGKQVEREGREGPLVTSWTELFCSLGGSPSTRKTGRPTTESHDPSEAHGGKAWEHIEKGRRGAVS